MIQLNVSNGNVFVWNAKDWLELRENHRIIGNLVGCLASIPRQESFQGLPLTLLPEEAALLIENRLAKIVTYKDVTPDIAKSVKEKYEEYQDRIKQEQISYYEEERKKQIVSMIDRIIEGKRRKVITAKGKKDLEACAKIDDIDKESILKTELEKASSVPITNTLIQTFTADVWTADSVSDDVEWSFPKTVSDRLRYLTFKDLWSKGYYITSGQKFGGDFLVYPGDPVKFHAQFIVVCMEEEAELTTSDLVTYGRLGSSTRKTFVIATISETSCVTYQSLTWADS